MTTRNRAVRSLSVLAIVAAIAAPAAAQVPGVSLQIVPRVGYFTPLGTLAEDLGQELKLGSSLAIGVSAELGLPMLPFDLRANVDHVLDTPVQFEDRDISDGRTLTVITGDLVFGGPRILPVRPYLLIGGGVKQYDLGRVASLGTSDGKSSDLTLHGGLGIDLKLGIFGLVAEVSDYVSRFEYAGESKMQNDIFGKVGVRVGMF